MDGKRLVAMRLAAGLSQVELARRCNLDPSIINRLESGQSSNPTRNTYLKLARALGMSLAELIIELETQPVAAAA